MGRRRRRGFAPDHVVSRAICCSAPSIPHRMSWTSPHRHPRLSGRSRRCAFLERSKCDVNGVCTQLCDRPIFGFRPLWHPGGIVGGAGHSAVLDGQSPAAAVLVIGHERAPGSPRGRTVLDVRRTPPAAALVEAGRASRTAQARGCREHQLRHRGAKLFFARHMRRGRQAFIAKVEHPCADHAGVDDGLARAVRAGGITSHAPHRRSGQPARRPRWAPGRGRSSGSHRRNRRRCQIAGTSTSRLAERVEMVDEIGPPPPA